MPCAHVTLYAVYVYRAVHVYTWVAYVNLHNKHNDDDDDDDKLCHPRSAACSAEQVLLNRQQIWSGGACLNCYWRVKI